MLRRHKTTIKNYVLELGTYELPHDEPELNPEITVGSEVTTEVETTLEVGTTLEAETTLETETTLEAETTVDAETTPPPPSSSTKSPPPLPKSDRGRSPQTQHSTWLLSQQLGSYRTTYHAPW